MEVDDNCRCVGGWRQAKGRVLGVLKEDGEANGSEWTDGGGVDEIDEDPPPSPPATASLATAAWIAETMTEVVAEVAMGGSDNDNRGQNGDQDDDVHPSSSCYYRPFSSSADPPAPSLPGVAGEGGGRVAAATTTRTTWRCCTLHRWRLDVGNANANGADAMVGCGNR